MTEIISLKRLAEIGGGFAPPVPSIKQLYLTLPTGQSSVSDPDLADSTIILLIRDTIPLEQVDASPTDRQYTLTGDTLDFSVINPTNDEQVYVLYYPTPTSGELMAIEPVSLSEVKTHLRVTFNDDDVELYKMISRCRKRIENYCNISIVAQRIQVVARICGEWQLPYGPVTAVETVENRDKNAGSGPTQYTASAAEWLLDGDTFNDNDYPEHISTRDRFYPDNRSRITYTAGMEFVPADLKLAILSEIAYRYENRGDETTALSSAAIELANPYRKLWL